MRKIEIVDDVRLKFPGRGAEFDLGVEVGAITVLMAQGTPAIDRQISNDALEQIRPIAERFGYTIIAIAVADDSVIANIALRSRKPKLRLVAG